MDRVKMKKVYSLIMGYDSVTSWLLDVEKFSIIYDIVKNYDEDSPPYDLQWVNPPVFNKIYYRGFILGL